MEDANTQTFEDVLDLLQSRNCKLNMQAYKSEVKNLESFANPTSFMTMSHSNLERQLKQSSSPPSQPPLTERETEKALFNRYMNL